MIGNVYRATGITVAHDGRSWSANVAYFDDGFASDDTDRRHISTEGTLHTRYMVESGKREDALTVAIDTVKADAERLGIRWEHPTVYMVDGGESDLWTYPKGWRKLVNDHARRLGWETTYDEER